MANEAHKEPTMEEILSSIRKIISEEETSASEPEAEPLEPSDTVAAEAVNDDFEDLALDDHDGEDSFGDGLEEDIFESSETFDASGTEEDAFELQNVVSAPEDDFVVDDPEPAPVDEFEAVIDDEHDLAEPTPPEPQPEPQLVHVEKEPEMAVAAKMDTSALTDETTADAAAGALGQLLSKMDMSSENTIDGLVRELLKPMIKEWLDANLQGIVEAKVEAEVARIARMAR